MYSLVDRAIGFAARAHEGQRRKTGNVPFIAHPVGVAMLLLEMGCDDEVVAAGLLHDTVEDTKVSIEDIRQEFGDGVADIVAGCTEPPKKRGNWGSRKRHSIQSLRNASLNVKLVSAADKYHNLVHIRYTKNNLGPAMWKRFGEGEEQQAWYYRSVYDSLISNVEELEEYSIFNKLGSEIESVFAGIQSQAP